MFFFQKIIWAFLLEEENFQKIEIEEENEDDQDE